MKNLYEPSLAVANIAETDGFKEIIEMLLYLEEDRVREITAPDMIDNHPKMAGAAGALFQLRQVREIILAKSLKVQQEEQSQPRL